MSDDTERNDQPKFHGQRQQVRAMMMALMEQGMTPNEAATALMVEAVNLMSTLENPDFTAQWLQGIAAKLEYENTAIDEIH